MQTCTHTRTCICTHVCIYTHTKKNPGGYVSNQCTCITCVITPSPCWPFMPDAATALLDIAVILVLEGVDGVLKSAPLPLPESPLVSERSLLLPFVLEFCMRCGNVKPPGGASAMVPPSLLCRHGGESGGVSSPVDDNMGFPS